MSSNLITRGFLERPSSSFVWSISVFRMLKFFFSYATGRNRPPQPFEIVTQATFEIDKPGGSRYTLAGKPALLHNGTGVP
jgi:hypothetical protein